MPWSSQAFIASIIIVQGDNGGVFIYNSSGQLVDSIAFQANVDPQTSSNKTGITTYNPGIEFAQLDSAILTLGSLRGNTTITAPAIITLNDSQTAGAQPSLALESPAAGHAVTQVIILGASADNTKPAQVVVGTPPAITSDFLEVQGNLGFGGTTAATIATFSTDATGYPGVTDGTGGLALNLSGCQPASGNKNTVTQTTFTNLAFGQITANDAEANAVYELECGGYGVQGSTAQNLTFQARFGASPGADTDVVGVAAVLNLNAVVAINDTFQWSAKVRAECLTSGAGATWRIYVTGTVTDTTVAAITTAATVSFAVGSGSSDVTQDSTAIIRMGLSAKWASTTGAPTITKSGSMFGRRG